MHLYWWPPGSKSRYDGLPLKSSVKQVSSSFEAFQWMDQAAAARSPVSSWAFSTFHAYLCLNISKQRFRTGLPGAEAKKYLASASWDGLETPMGLKPFKYGAHKVREFKLRRLWPWFHLETWILLCSKLASSFAICSQKQNKVKNYVRDSLTTSKKLSYVSYVPCSIRYSNNWKKTYYWTTTLTSSKKSIRGALQTVRCVQTWPAAAAAPSSGDQTRSPRSSWRFRAPDDRRQVQTKMKKKAMDHPNGCFVDGFLVAWVI